MPVTTLREHQMQERQLRSTLDMIKEFAEDYQQERDERQIDVRLSMLDDALAKFYVVRRKIDVLTDISGVSVTEQKEQVAEHTKVVWEFENLYCEVKGMLLELRPKPEATTTTLTNVPPVAPPASTVCRVKLPDIKLPSFAGKLENWITFRDTFRSLIHNNQTLSAIDKFTYLRTSLEEEALQEIGAIELTAANYEVAWNLLEKRYENKKLILKTHLDAIFSVEPVRKECFEALNHLLSTVDKNLQMIDKLGVKTAEWSILLAHIVCSKLDSTTLRHWEAHFGSREFVKYEILVDFLREHCAVLQSIAPMMNTAPVERHLPKYASSYVETADIRVCYFCNEPQHSVFQCPAVRQMSCAERVAVAKRNRLCFNCLSSGHVVGMCSRGFCTLCNRKHHTLLHESFAPAPRPAASVAVGDPNALARPHTVNPQNTQPPQTMPQDQHRHTPTQSTQHLTQTSAQPSSQQVSTPPTTEYTTTCNHSYTLASSRAESPREVLLPTAVVRIFDSEGNMSFARALLDSGSQRNLMTKEFAQKLKCNLVPDNLQMKGIGTLEIISTCAVTATVCSRSSSISQFAESMRFHVLENVTSKLPSNDVDVEQLGIPENLKLADPLFYRSGSVDMIIGAEYYCDLLNDRRLKLGDNNPTMQGTVFGWIVSGVADGVSAEADLTSKNHDLLANIQKLKSCHSQSTFVEGAWEKFFNLGGLRSIAEMLLVLLVLALLCWNGPTWLARNPVTSEVNVLSPWIFDGVMQNGGRLRNAAMSSGEHPFMLDQNHPLEEWVVSVNNKLDELAKLCYSTRFEPAVVKAKNGVSKSGISKICILSIADNIPSTQKKI